MKDAKKIPVWPLYAADLLMFAAVFAMVLPAINGTGDVGLGTSFLCCIMVLGGMALCLVPYWFEAKENIAARTERADKNGENFRIIFDELAALRMMLAEQEEKIDGNTFASHIDGLEKGLISLRDSAKAKLGEIDDSLASTAKTADLCQAADKEIRNTLEDIGADIVVMKELFSSSSESSADDFAILRKRADKSESALDAVAKGIERLGEKIAALENRAEESEPSAKSISAPKLGGMMNRALNGASRTRMSVEKFVELSKPDIPDSDAQDETPAEAEAQNLEVGEEEKAATENEPRIAYDEEGDQMGDFALAAPKEIPGDDKAEAEESQETTDDNEVTDTDNADGSDEIPTPTAETDTTESPQNEKSPKSKREKDDADFFNQKGSADKDSEPAKTVHSDDIRVEIEQTQSASKTPDESAKSDMLFDVPATHEKGFKPRKKDAVITVNALIGIGNKPFLRGDGAGLSPDRGIPMEYVEIGKWQYILPPFENPVNFTVFKNDISPSDDGESRTINSGEKLELNLSFTAEPQE